MVCYLRDQCCLITLALRLLKIVLISLSLTFPYILGTALNISVLTCFFKFLLNSIWSHSDALPLSSICNAKEKVGKEKKL